MKSLTKAEFQDSIWDFYKKHRRSFPWRETTDPYRIMISEIMLQQTQTSRVVEKYQAWLEAFPTVEALAKAPTSQVLQYWQGLGYNRRALNLHKAAQIIVKDFAGQIPDTPRELEQLPGIGPYTAAAISAFAFNRPLPLIETNIRRVFIHFYFPDEETVSDKELMPLIEETLDPDNPREWYYALMDYGAELPKKVANPNRRSKHYTKQSKFEGSNRQARGKILAYLLKYKKASMTALVQKLDLEKERLEKGLEELEKEGFIASEEELYFLR